MAVSPSRLSFYGGKTQICFVQYSEGNSCCCLVAESCLTLLQPHGLYVACQAPLSMEFSRQEYWGGFPFPSQGIFSMQRLNSGLLCLLHCKGGSLPLVPPFQLLRIPFLSPASLGRFSPFLVFSHAKKFKLSWLLRKGPA